MKGGLGSVILLVTKVLRHVRTKICRCLGRILQRPSFLKSQPAGRVHHGSSTSMPGLCVRHHAGREGPGGVGHLPALSHSLRAQETMCAAMMLETPG